jgi:hypothetical protein
MFQNNQIQMWNDPPPSSAIIIGHNQSIFNTNNYKNLG